MKKTLLLTLALLLSLTACTRNPSNPQIDPHENFNRAMFAFNLKLERLIFRPVAKTYNAIAPIPLQRGVSNFFDNLHGVTVVPNDLLQGKFRYAVVDTTRLVINTIFGIGGLFDVASKLGIPKHYEDFGLTLSYWGSGRPAKYLVLPFFGPNTFRSGFGLPFDYFMSPWAYIKNKKVYYGVLALRTIDIYHELIPAYKLIDTAFDPYIFVRHSYLAHRNNQIKTNLSDQIVHNDNSTASRISAATYSATDNNVGNNEAGGEYDPDTILEPGEDEE